MNHKNEHETKIIFWLLRSYVFTSNVPPEIVAGPKTTSRLGDFSPVAKYVLIDLSETIIVSVENIIREEIKYKKLKNSSVPIWRSKL